MREKVEKIFKRQELIRKEQEQLQNEVNVLKADLVDREMHDCLDINWSRLCRRLDVPYKGILRRERGRA